MSVVVATTQSSSWVTAENLKSALKKHDKVHKHEPKEGQKPGKPKVKDHKHVIFDALLDTPVRCPTSSKKRLSKRSHAWPISSLVSNCQSPITPNLSNHRKACCRIQKIGQRLSFKN